MTPGTVVQWWDRSTGGRRIGTVASVRSTRRGDVLRIMQGDGSTNEPALYMASRNARGVLDFPASEVQPYQRRRWPDDAPEVCDECGSPEPGGGCDADCPTRDEDSREVLPEPDEPTPAPALPPLVFVEPRDLATDAPGDGPPLALF